MKILRRIQIARLGAYKAKEIEPLSAKQPFYPQIHTIHKERKGTPKKEKDCCWLVN